MQLNADIKKLTRHYIAENFEVNSKDDVIPHFEELLKRELTSVEDLKQWMQDSSELEAALSEDVCWRQINMTRDTENKSYEESFTNFVMHIEPHLKPFAHKLNEKLIASPFVTELGDEYQILLRSVKNQVELYREENIPLEAEINVLAQQFGPISGKMSVEVDGKEFTLQQAAKFLQQSDRKRRESVYFKIAKRRAEDKENLDELFDTLLQKRHQVAVNAGFENYRDYMFKALGRFDYGVKQCEDFHASVKKYMLPIVEKIYASKKEKLGLGVLKPWDLNATPKGQQPLHPFKDGKELTDKAIAVYDKLNPFFGNCIRKMKEIEHLDLDSRKGKAPGGYNCPLAETGVPFIFMNAAGTADDVITMMHEGGHAFHSFLAHDLTLSGMKEYPMEMAELASMSMELFTFEHWDVFYENKEDLQRAQHELLERALTIFPWIATIDKFQHWIYTHPTHSREERTLAWVEILNEFYPTNIDTSELEDIRAIQWQRQLHLFEVPFYYIEYGIAQLGAIAMWKQYLENDKQAIENYTKALSLGYTKNLNELYKTAGIQFDFSETTVKELASFISERL
jgi:oligoendopeptidase F